MTNPYLDLTEQFNRGRRRALVSSGQAVVLHRLAIMSKDGDWVLREDDEAVRHVLDVLARRGARYRFGAPLDIRWLAGGWSAHLEHSRDGLRLRTDFVTRPPRISDAERDRLWRDADAAASDVVALEPLAVIKMTMREKDYAVIGELARRMPDPAAQRWIGSGGPSCAPKASSPSRRPMESAMREPRDEFLSEEDLDLQNLTFAELVAYWNLWLRQAQGTNDLDEAEYSHGVFDRDPAPQPAREGAAARPSES